MAPSLRNSYSTKDLTAKSRSRLFGFARDRDSKQGFGNNNRDSALLTSLDPFDAPIDIPSGSMAANNGKLPRPMLRSYSTSSAHTRGSSMSVAAGRLGQGAQVVRTPQDAMSSMAQPDSLNGVINRQSSLRVAGSRRPSAPPAPSSSFSTMAPPRASSPPRDPVPSPPRCTPVPLETPMESGLESSFDNLELLDTSRPSSRQLAPSSSRHELHGAHSSSSLSAARHGRQGSLASQPSYTSLASQYSHQAPSRSRAGSITAVTTAGVTAGVSRSPPRASPTLQQVVDVDAAYQQRRTQRMSNTTLTPSAHSSMSSAPSTPSMSSSSTTSTAGGVDILTPLGNGPRNGMGAGDSHPPQDQDDLYSSESHSADSLGELPVLSNNGSSNSSHHNHQHYPSPSPSRASGRGSPVKRPSHAGSMSVSSISSMAPFMRDTPTAAAPFAPVLVSHTSRPATGSNTSSVLVTLRFGFSLDAEPNTHDVTVTYDTLKPAGGRLMAFLDSALRPSSVESSGSTMCTSAEGPDMTTEGSTDEDSDFEYDDARLHPMLEDEYLASLSGGSSVQQKEVMVDGVPATPMAQHQPRPVRRRLPGQAFHHDGPSGGLFASVGALPPLSELPAALAHARAGGSASRYPAPAPTSYTAPLSVTPRARANTCPGPARGTVSELTVLLPRDAGAWHAVASRLCAGSWPELAAAKRRRVEDECRWAGMEGLVGELRAMGHAQAQAQAGRGGFV